MSSTRRTLKAAPGLRRRMLRDRGHRSVDTALLDELETRFGSYFEVKAWFDAEGIPYSHEFDSLA